MITCLNHCRRKSNPLAHSRHIWCKFNPLVFPQWAQVYVHSTCHSQSGWREETCFSQTQLAQARSTCLVSNLDGASLLYSTFPNTVGARLLHVLIPQLISSALGGRKRFSPKQLAQVYPTCLVSNKRSWCKFTSLAYSPTYLRYGWREETCFPQNNWRKYIPLA